MIILASQSPRRKELLARLVSDFETVTPQVAELVYADIPGDLVVLNAAIKAAAVVKEYPNATVIGADTVIVFNRRIIGKPCDLAEARSILKALSGNTHEVLTGVSVVLPNGCSERYLERTRVVFKPYSDEVVDAYLQRVNVLDKAGAYGIQEHGEMLLDHYEGELENIIGLPLKRLATLL